MVVIFDRLHFKATGGEKKYRHTSKENKQTTKLQNFLDYAMELGADENEKRLYKL